MHLSGSPLLRDTKSESPDEANVINSSNSGSFSVIFRPGETSANSGMSSDHESLQSHRYAPHTPARLAGIHSRPEEGANCL